MWGIFSKIINRKKVDVGRKHGYTGLKTGELDVYAYKLGTVINFHAGGIEHDENKLVYDKVYSDILSTYLMNLEKRTNEYSIWCDSKQFILDQLALYVMKKHKDTGSHAYK